MTPAGKNVVAGLFSAVVLASLYGSAERADASKCFSSAESVKHAFPGSWPSWTKRDASHKGERCWFPKGQHAVEEPRHVKVEVVKAPREDIARLARVMSNIVWIGPRTADSFNDRFAAAFHVSSLNRPSTMQQLMDPVGVVP